MRGSSRRSAFAGRRSPTGALRALALAGFVGCVASLAAHGFAQVDPAAGPVIVVETSRGTFAFDTFPHEAPKTVAHIVDLVERGFYNGQRVHRALPGFIVQFGDPQTRDPAKQAVWGRGAEASSGAPIGAVEFSKRHLNVKGAVGIAHQGNPAAGDSQIYIALADRPDLDGRYVVFGQVIEGANVPGELQVGDEIVKVTVRR